MKLIVGLGNPGTQYENTRHNAGFIAIDAFAKKNDIEFKLEPKFKGAIGMKVFNGDKVFLLKPMTYMNLSGESVIAVMNFYKIDVEDIDEELISNHLYTAGEPDPDLLIRTSRELRTSNFLPWQLVYTEFYFPDKHWPDFGKEDLIEAIRVYQKRNRRFGGRP